MVAVTIELQGIIALTALIVGAVRGIAGYYLNAPKEESFDVKKVIKTIIRYAVMNLIAVNGSAAIGGVGWTVEGVVIISVIWLAQDLGIDTYKNVISPPQP